MKIEIMDSTKKKGFLNEFKDFFSEDIFIKRNELFLKSGSEQIRIYSGNLLTEEVMRIWRNFPTEAVGLYFGKSFIDKKGRRESRLSLEGLHCLRGEIKNLIVELDVKQVESWFSGNNIELSAEQKIKYSNFLGKFVAVMSGQNKDFIGTGKLTEQGILLSFLPKERRVRN